VTPAPAAGPPDACGHVRFEVWGGTAIAVVSDPDGARRAEELLRAELTAFDQTCSRFRAHSEIRQLAERAGSPAHVSPLLAEILDVAMRAAQLTDGLVDPTVGRALAQLGYDRDFSELPPDRPALPPSPAPGWRRLGWDRHSRTLVLPRGIELDVGATAKALAADRAATKIAAELGTGALVSLAGDVSVAGRSPAGGWLITIGDDHSEPRPHHLTGADTTVQITSGGLATSGTTRRRWRSGGQLRHHIIDPRTGQCAPPLWRTVSVAAGNCVDANTASTAAIILGAAAPQWLAAAGVPARLVTHTGEIRTVAGWPEEIPTLAGAEVAG